MYPPPYHQENSFDKIVETIRRYPLATLISPIGGDCLITHVPVIYKKDNSPYGKIIGHIDSNNPQCDYLSERKVYLIFHGPDTYISPTTYTTVQPPTWNYIKVHIEGICNTIDDTEAAKKVLIDMANTYEKTGSAYKLEHDNPHMNYFVNYIQAFEVIIDKWEGKFKLSQDKIEADTKAAREKLILDTKADMRDFIEGVI